jgi:hypothetical protein
VSVGENIDSYCKQLLDYARESREMERRMRGETNQEATDSEPALGRQCRYWLEIGRGQMISDGN